MCIPPHTTIPPGRIARSAAGTNAAYRCKDYRRIEFFRRYHIRTTRPCRAHFERKFLRSRIARAVNANNFRP